MGFRFRLASFFVAVLILVQGLTAVLVYQVARHQLIGEGQRQLGVAAKAFVRQLDDISGRTADSVQVLSLDFALRSAIAQHDQATLLSALRNHGHRVGAQQMLLVDIDGRVEADTLGNIRAGTPFPYRDLVDPTRQRPAAAIVAWNGNAYWMVVVPVFAPTLVGYIAAALPVDKALLARLQQQSALPKSIELASPRADGRWMVLARGDGDSTLAASLGAGSRAMSRQPQVITVDGREFVAQAVTLDRSRQSAPVVAVLGYSVDAALQPYRSVMLAWLALTLAGLVIGLFGAWLIARGVSRPVEALAASARRIEAGDYSYTVEGRTRRDELGQLASAFSNMAQSIHEREARILHQAGHDQVTGLANRTATEADIQPQLSAQSGALLMVGLARVPDIVKTMGHEISDRVMRDAGTRLRGASAGGLLARATDTEFSIFLPGAARAAAITAAFRIVETLTDPYREADLTLDLAPAVGIALVPVHGRDAGTLLRRAEVALFGALGSEDPVAVYDPATDPHRPERLSLMGDLREAIERDHIELHYQPKLNLATGQVDSAEGLVRWTHPLSGPVPPDAFIPLAEESGNIRRLTRWALATGIAQAGRWAEQGRAIKLSINVSARDLDDPELPRRISELLALHKVPSERIVLEITESAIMGKPDAAITVLRRLAERGIDLAIDDFGVGQSSFAYLRRLPVRELKIDKTFIERLAEVREDQVIVRSIIDLGHDLGYRVTAEGVEDPAALAFLFDAGCDHAQGYLIARALAVADFDEFLAAGQWPVRQPVARLQQRS